MDTTNSYYIAHGILAEDNSDTLVYMQNLTLLTIPSLKYTLSKKLSAGDCDSDRQVVTTGNNDVSPSAWLTVRCCIRHGLTFLLPPAPPIRTLESRYTAPPPPNVFDFLTFDIETTRQISIWAPKSTIVPFSVVGLCRNRIGTLPSCTSGWKHIIWRWNFDPICHSPGY